MINRQIGELQSRKKLLVRNKKIIEKHNAILEEIFPNIFGFINTVNEEPEEIRLVYQMRGVEGFKTPEVLRVLEYLEGIADGSSTHDWPEYINRDFQFSWTTGTGTLLVYTVSVYVKSNSTQCRKVAVGTEVKTTAVTKYKLVCD
jgi:hypothetical protein